MKKKPAMTSSSATALAPNAKRLNVVAWIYNVLRNPETNQPFDLLPAEIYFLEHAFDLNEDGSAKYPELVYSAPKKSGKTAFAAILTLVIVLLYGGHDPEGIVAANDLDQSSARVFSAIKKIVKASPKLRQRAKITKETINFPETGASITAIASDYAGAAGSNSVVSTFDELWGFVSEGSRRLWDELVPPPTRKAAWRLTVTYAGFSGESKLLEELYQHGVAQQQIAPDLYAGEGQLTFWTHEPVAPWQTPRWYEQMRRQMRPNQFARMIENRWVTSESSFIDLAAWDACVEHTINPVDSDLSLPVYVAVDASLKRDSTAIVVVTSDGERVRLVTHFIFQPSPENPLDFEATIEATIIDLCRKFDVQSVRYDPWQMASVAQRMIRLGVPMQEFAQTSGNLTDSSSNLYELIKNHNLAVYADAPMRTSISQAVAVETPRGWRISKEKAKHKIDVVVALGMACHAAVKQKFVAGWGVLEFYRRQAESVKADPAPSQTPELVKVFVPGEPSHISTLSGVVIPVEIVDGARVVWMSKDDALAMVSSPRNLAMFEANNDLRARLIAEAPKPQLIRNTNILPRSPFDRGGLVMDTLRDLRRI